jgi:hypothetical protein
MAASMTKTSRSFAPLVPCHRVISSDGYVGGFYGEWGLSGAKKSKGTGLQPARK